jgi:hypothetical protein
MSGRMLVAGSRQIERRIFLAWIVRQKLFRYAQPLHLLARSCGYYGQGQQQVEIVIGCDAVEALKATAEAAMNNHKFAVGPLEASHGLHRSATGAQAISRRPVIDVTRVETVRAVIAL